MTIKMKKLIKEVGPMDRRHPSPRANTNSFRVDSLKDAERIRKMCKFYKFKYKEMDMNKFYDQGLSTKDNADIMFQMSKEDYNSLMVILQDTNIHVN